MIPPPTKSQKEKSKLTKDEWREYTKTVWHIANTSDPLHPAVFPVEIPRRLIKLFSFHGELVLDPFGGVGTTATAAMELGRRATCIEQNAEHPLVQASARGGLNTIKTEIPEIEPMTDPVLRLERTANAIIYQAFDSASVLGLPIRQALLNGFAMIPPATMQSVSARTHATWWRFV